MMLDHGAHQAVERFIRDQDVLELVEADDREPAVRFMQRPWDIKQLEKRGARLVCRPGLDG